MKTSEQLELFTDFTPRETLAPIRPRPVPAPVLQDLPTRLEQRLGGVLQRLTLTSNRSTFLSAQWDAERTRLQLRIQRCFERAPDGVLDAVTIYVTSWRRSKKSRLALELLRLWFNENVPPPGEGPGRRKPRVRTQGSVHDLRSIRDRLNTQHFEGGLSVSITWGRARRRRTGRLRRRWTLQLGSYCAEENLIRVHSVLDQPHVPLHVVEAVVHHELVHASMPVRRNGTRRRRLHGPEFERRERLYPQLKEAGRWLDRHLRRLLDES